MPTKDELERENDELSADLDKAEQEIAELKAKLEQADRDSDEPTAKYSINSLRYRRQQQIDAANKEAEESTGKAVEVREPTHEPFAPSVAEEGVVSDPPSTSTSVAKAATTGQNADGNNSTVNPNDPTTR